MMRVTSPVVTSRAALALVVFCFCVCQTWTWQAPLARGVLPASSSRPATRRMGGARDLTCGFRDALKKLNPFGKVSKSEEVRRQWAALKTASSSSPVDMSALVGAPAAPPAVSRTSKLRQELAAREAERERAWSEPVPTGTAAIFDAQTPVHESEEDLRRRQAAAAADMERVLGKKLLQEREREIARPEVDRQERLEIAKRAEAMQADMDRTLGRKIAIEASKQIEQISAIKRTPPRMPDAGESPADGTPASPPTPAEPREPRRLAEAENPTAHSQRQSVPMTVGEMRAKTAAEDEIAGYERKSRESTPAAPASSQPSSGEGLSLRELTKAKSAGISPAQKSQEEVNRPRLTLRELTKAKSAGVSPVQESQEEEEVDRPRNNAALGRQKTFAEETAEMTAGKTVGDVLKGKTGVAKPSGGGRLSLRELMKAKSAGLSPAQESQDEVNSPRNNAAVGRQKTFAEETAEMTAGKTVGDVAKHGTSIPKSAWALPKYVTKRVDEKKLTPEEQQKKGRQLGPKLDTSVQVEVAPQKPPPDTPQTVLPPKHLSLRELTKAAGKASASPSVGAEKEPISAQDREEVQKEDAAAALMRTLARRRIPRAPAGDEAAGQAPRDEVAEERQKKIVEHVSRADGSVSKTRWKVVNQKGLALHLERGGSAEVVGQLKSFQVLTIDEERDGWLHVCAPMFGWVQLRSPGGESNLIRMGKMLQG